MNPEAREAAAASTVQPRLSEMVEAEIEALGRIIILSREQRAAVGRDDVAALDAAGHEIDELLRQCSRMRRHRDRMAADPEAAPALDRLRATATALVEELSINRRVLREALASVNERASLFYRPSASVYGRPTRGRASGMVDQ